MLNEFFAVTKTGIYRVWYDEQHFEARAEKVALKGNSRVPIGFLLRNGTMVAVCQNLVAYFPQGGGVLSLLTHYDRRIENVNPNYRGNCTSAITALFETEAEAYTCLFCTHDLQPRDPRFLEETNHVIAQIGNDHPGFYVCRQPGQSLLAEESKGADAQCGTVLG